MANITFTVKRSKSTDTRTLNATIYIRYRIGRNLDFSSSTGLKINYDDWDAKKQSLKNRSTITNRRSVLETMSNLKQHLEKFENQNLENGIIPSYQDVKVYFKTFYKESIDHNQNLLSFIEAYIEESKTIPNPTTFKLIAVTTLRSYRTHLTHLKGFCKEKYKVDFNSVSLDWYFDFKNYFESKGYSLNYFGKQIKILKTLLNVAEGKGIKVNQDFRKPRFKVLREESESIYLSEHELKLMWDLDLTSMPVLDRVRDLFLIGAYTALRVSDFNSLKSNNLIEENNVRMIRVKTNKTGKVVAIPLHPVVELILNKYDGDIESLTKGKPLTDQMINLSIKDIGRLARINERIEVSQTKGGLNTSITKKKYQLITSHTARRSFCTNAYFSGMSVLDIMTISGHKTESVFLQYIKATPEQRAIKISETPSFKGTSNLRVV